jgi:hypothetical protein
MSILVLPHGFHNNVGWNWTLLRMLASSGMFKVMTEKFPIVPYKVAKSCNFTFMKVNDKLVGLDTWDSIAPSGEWFEKGFFNIKPLKDLKLLIKIQWFNCEFWRKFTTETGIPVTAWTVMPNSQFRLSSFMYNVASNHTWYGMVTGRNYRFGRQEWVKWCSINNGFHTDINCNITDTIDDYIDRLKKCKWGIILHGRKGAEKNRRESEFTSCGIPLAMNYDPQYPFDFIAGKHYVKLTKPSDLIKLKTINPEPFAIASKQLYRDHFSPSGISKTLIKLVDRCV